MSKFYKISCIIMAVMTFIALGFTVFVGSNGSDPAENKAGYNPVNDTAGLIFITVMLAVMAILLVFCLCLSEVGGGKLYKLGFYLLHAGVVVLIAGFIITNLKTEKYYSFYDTETGGFLGVMQEKQEDDGQDVHLPGYSAMRDMTVKEAEIRYYEDGITPSFYGATLCFGEEDHAISMNHPVRQDGVKIYLMSIDTVQNQLILLVKSNPGEYVVILGIAVLCIGTFMMCFSGFSGRKRQKENDAYKNGSLKPARATVASGGKDGKR